MCSYIEKKATYDGCPPHEKHNHVRHFIKRCDTRPHGTDPCEKMSHAGDEPGVYPGGQCRNSGVAIGQKLIEEVGLLVLG